MRNNMILLGSLMCLAAMCWAPGAAFAKQSRFQKMVHKKGISVRRLKIPFRLFVKQMLRRKGSKGRDFVRQLLRRNRQYFLKKVAGELTRLRQGRSTRAKIRRQIQAARLALWRRQRLRSLRFRKRGRVYTTQRGAWLRGKHLLRYFQSLKRLDKIIGEDGLRAKRALRFYQNRAVYMGFFQRSVSHIRLRGSYFRNRRYRR